MEAPNLVRWLPSGSDGPDFFECELGGKDTSFESTELNEDEFYAVFKLLQHRNSLLLALLRQKTNCNSSLSVGNENEQCSNGASVHANEKSALINRDKYDTTGNKNSSRNTRSEAQNSTWKSSTSFSLAINDIFKSWSGDLTPNDVSTIIIVQCKVFLWACNLRPVQECIH